MKNLKGACVLGQSGGPTSVINASAAGVFLEALNQECITARVFDRRSIVFKFILRSLYTMYIIPLFFLSNV